MYREKSLREIRSAILDLLEEREGDKTICPSEVARLLDAESWRRLMPAVRIEAIAMAARGEIEIRQRGKVAIPDDGIRGPIRLGKNRSD